MSLLGERPQSGARLYNRIAVLRAERGLDRQTLASGRRIGRTRHLHLQPCLFRRAECRSSICGAFSAGVAIPGGRAIRQTASGDTHCNLLLPILINATTVPQAFILWTEPDAIEDH